MNDEMPPPTERLVARLRRHARKLARLAPRQGNHKVAVTAVQLRALANLAWQSAGRLEDQSPNPESVIDPEVRKIIERYWELGHQPGLETQAFLEERGSMVWFDLGMLAGYILKLENALKVGAFSAPTDDDL